MSSTNVPATHGTTGNEMIRLSDADRSQGERLLNEHVVSGCLTSDEYGDRVVQAKQTRTRGELLTLFRDLPEPHPRFGAREDAARQDDARQDPARAPEPASAVQLPIPRRHLRAATAAVAIPCSMFGAITGLFFAADTPMLLPVAFVIVGALYLVLLTLGDRFDR